MNIESILGEFVEADPRWTDVIRAAAEWTLEKRAEGLPESFTRATIFYRLGQPEEGVPVLTRLVTAGLFARDFTNAKGRPYYRVVVDPGELVTAIERAPVGGR